MKSLCFSFVALLALALPTYSYGDQSSSKGRRQSYVEAPQERLHVSDYCTRILKKDAALTIQEAEALVDRFLKFDFDPKPKLSGFRLRTNDSATSAERRIIVPSTSSDYTYDQTQLWHLNGANYEYISTGFRNLEAYANRVDQLVIDHIVNYPNLDLDVSYDADRMKAYDALRKSRWAIHDAVIKKYQELKGYLSPKDISILKALNFLSGNYDVFALVGHNKGEKVESLTYEQIQERVALTLQISYFGVHNYFEPSARSLLSTANLPVYMNEDKFPFEYRIPAKFSEDFRKTFYARFTPEITCEMVRYVKFVPQLAPAIRDRFLLNAFRTAQLNGMRYIIAGGDDKTVEVFKRYGFKLYSNLPTGSTKTREYLYFLDLESTEYKAVVAALSSSSDSVMVFYGGGGA